MSVSDKEYAILSNAAYHDENYIDPANYGFERISTHRNDVTGFYGETYKRGNDVVVVFRGTDNNLNRGHDVDWVTLGMKPPEFGSALDYYKKIENEITENYPGAQLSMTGHSLGGGAVQYVNAMLSVDGENPHQVQGVTFGAGGAGNVPQCRGINPDYIAVRNIVRANDPVPHTLDRQLGSRQSLAATDRSYAVKTNENGIGEIVAFPASYLTAHSMIGYLVDVGGLARRNATMAEQGLEPDGRSAQDRFAQWLAENRQLSLAPDIRGCGGAKTVASASQESTNEGFDFHKALAEHSKGNDEMYARLDALRGGQIVAQQLPQPDQGLARC